MAISGISSAFSSGAVQSSSSCGAGRQRVDRDGDGDGDGGGARVSQRGKMMSQLQQLQQQDPAKFKQFMTEEAAKLKDAASKATGEDAKRLSSLADKFQQSASSGDLSAFQPKQGAQSSASATGVQAYQAQAQGGHHHHHHGGGGSAGGGGAVAQALSSLSSDLASALGAAA